MRVEKNYQETCRHYKLGCGQADGPLSLRHVRRRDHIKWHRNKARLAELIRYTEAARGESREASQRASQIPKYPDIRKVEVNLLDSRRNLKAKTRE